MNENKYTDLSQSKRLAKVFGDKAPEADGWWAFDIDNNEWFLSEIPVISLNYVNVIQDIDSFRLDTLLLELPKPEESRVMSLYNRRLQDLASFMIDRNFNLKEAITIVVDLLELLKSEGLNE